MKRLFPLLFLTGLIFAQFDDVLSDDPFSDVNSSGDEPSVEEDLFGDVPVEPAPSEQPPSAPPPPAAPSDDSFLDDLIDNQPVITQPPPPPPPPPPQEQDPAPAVPPLPAEEAIPAPAAVAEPPAAQLEPAQPSATVPAGGGPGLVESSGEKPPKKMPPVDDGVKSSTTPEINVAVVQESPDIPQFSHKKHLEEVGAECVQCHQTLFSESIRGYRSGPSMKEICSQCHNGTDAPAEVLAGFSNEKKYVKTYMPLFSHTIHIEHTEDCKTCHRDIYGELKKIRIPPPMAVCNECHNNSKANASCRVCHEDPSKLKPKSHTPRWVYRNGHGTDARYNQTQCRDCHVDRECSRCHRGQGTFSVHRAAYKYTHGMDARQRQVNCNFCHDLENSCAKCHVRTR